MVKSESNMDPEEEKEKEKEKEMDKEKENDKHKDATEVVFEVEELPKTIVRRVVKNKLSQLSSNSEIQVLHDSLQAFSESGRIFIHYLSAAANDICKEANRQIINAEDVFKALEEIEFIEFISPLRASLEEFRKKNAVKKSGSSKPKNPNKKAKMEEQHPESGGGSKKPAYVGEDDEETA